MTDSRSDKIWNALCAKEPVLTFLCSKVVEIEMPNYSPDSREVLRLLLRLVNKSRRHTKRVCVLN